MKRNSIKISALSLMAAIGGMMGTSNVSQQSTRDFQQTVKRDHSNKNQSPESQRISQESKSMRITNNVNRGLFSGSNRSYGIDPKTYGMRYVKRGTHKRTNI